MDRRVWFEKDWELKLEWNWVQALAQVQARIQGWDWAWVQALAQVQARIQGWGWAWVQGWGWAWIQARALARTLARMLPRTLAQVQVWVRVLPRFPAGPFSIASPRKDPVRS